MTEYALTGTSAAVSTATGNLKQTFGVSGTSAALSAATGELIIFPLFDIRDNNNLQIEEIHFESIYPGLRAATQIIKLINNSNSSRDLTITSEATSVPVGTAIDTYRSTYLGESEIGASNPLSVTIPAYDDTNIYIDYQPPSTAKIGEKEWALNIEDASLPSVSLTDWSYVNTATVTGSSDGELSNYQIRIIIPYEYIIMNTDFSDIRFYLSDGTELKYNLFEKTDSVTATFDVLIPTIPASPGTVTIHILSGNIDAVDDSSPEDVYLFNDFFTGTVLDSDKWDLNIVNTITSTVNDYLQVTDATHGTGTENYIYDGTDIGSQHQAKYTLPTNFNIVWDSTLNTVLASMGQVGIGLVASDNTVIVMLSHDDPSPSNYYYWRSAITESSWTNKAASWTQESANQLAIGKLNNDKVTYTIKVRGNNISVYEDDNKIGDTIITSTPSKLAIIAGSTNAQFPTYVQLEKLIVTKNTPNAPSVGSLGTWVYYIQEMLKIKAGILYRSKELPDFEPEIRHGCKIGGVLYE